MSDRKPLPGKFVWFELVSKEPKKAQAFYRDVLGWKVQAFPMGDQTYEMIYAGDTMIGRARAVAKRRDASVDPPRCLVDIEIQVTNQHGVLCCPVELTLQMPETRK